MDLLLFLALCELLHSLSSAEGDIISQHEMPEHVSKGGILLILQSAFGQGKKALLRSNGKCAEHSVLWSLQRADFYGYH